MVRDNEVIDAELRLLTAVCPCIHSLGGHPSTTHIDALLDERTTHPLTPRNEDEETASAEFSNVPPRCS